MDDGVIIGCVYVGNAPSYVWFHGLLSGSVRSGWLADARCEFGLKLIADSSATLTR